jgi:hypothetical protein
MDGRLAADRAWRGLGRAARALGAPCRLYRPGGAAAPLREENFVMTLDAAFVPDRGGWGAPARYGEALWQGVFDAAYVRAGDYLLRAESRAGAGDGGVWLVASAAPLLPALCVRAQRVVDISRAAAPVAAGEGEYGGVGDGAREALLSGWPASLLDDAGNGAYQANLPTGTALSAWRVLLRGWPGVVLRAGDQVADDLGRVGVVAAAELSELGWRLHVTQAAA